MPSKVRKPADPARSRLNQQRSRARHQAYVEDLERRVREYETRGFEATAAMQSSARAVARQNERLIALLQRYGVPQHDIDACTEANGEKGGSSAGLVTETTASPPRTLLHPPSATPEATFRVLEVPITASPSRPTKCKSLRRCGDLKPVCEGPDIRNPSASPSAPTLSSSKTAEEVTPCEDAAGMIADTQGHGDRSQARDLLGCPPASKCHVRTSRLFQLLVDTA